ncbi:MAG: mismatch-specific DNA-glycosylase, partial [Proteobacteria bacterium]|nr:mismatch-specific DNA-glycosylase [Pseudomonadota bacterium]
RRRAYYAHFSNKFWEILAESGLTERQLDPEDYARLTRYGIGLTDINKTEFGSDHELTGSGDNPRALLDKIEQFQPKILAFNGKNNFRMFANEAYRTSKSTPVDYGLQSELMIKTTEIWVLPNTSARARGYWDPVYWYKLSKRHQEKSKQ